MNGRALSLTANTEGEKDGRAGRNAILQRSLFKSTLSIQYIFYITWLTSLQFSDSSRLKFCSLIDNLLIPNFLKISKFKILRDTSAFHVIPSLNISSRLEQTVSSWMKKKERKRRRGILSRMKTRRSKKHVVRNIDTFTESGDLADQCRVLHSRSHILYEAIPRFIASGIGGAHSKIYELVSISDKWIASQSFWTMDGWRDTFQLRGMIINFEQGGNIGCNDILIIFKKTRTTLIRSVNYFQLLLWIIGE